MSTKRWGREEEEFLKDNYGKMTNRDLAEKFGVSAISIQRKLSRLNCIRQKQKKWEADEEAYLREHYLEQSDAELAKHFDVTATSIKRKLHRLKLSRSVRKSARKDSAKQGRTQSVARVSAPEATRKPDIRHRPDVSVYSMSDSYKVNQKVYHDFWKDEGVVKKVFKTAGGNRAILVDFDKLGERKLISEYTE